MREREQDLLSQLDDVIVAAQLAEEETEVDIEDVSESEDPHSPSPMKNARARASSSGSRKMNVANLVATNRDLVDMASRQSNEISRLQAERSKLRAELTKSEAALARLTKFKDENLALACKYKANLQKTSDEIKARQLVESRLHEYEHTARALEETVEQLRSELSRASERRTEAASMKEASEIEKLREELSEMKRSLNAVQMEKKTMLEELSAQLKEITVASRRESESTQPRDEDVHETSFADYLAHEAAEAEAAMHNNDLYAQRLDEEIAKVEREMRGGAAKPPRTTPTRSRDASPSPIQRQNVIDTAKEATQVALDVCESTKQRAMYYKGVAKMVYGKLQTQKASYDAKLAALKLKLDAVVTAPATPSLKTPLSAIAREHSFLLDT
jgi:DNA repair exonuclease SbcCD ATPase subunit